MHHDKHFSVFYWKPDKLTDGKLGAIAIMLLYSGTDSQTEELCIVWFQFSGFWPSI